MTRYEDLDFPALNCSLQPTLGDYYQDFSDALIILEDGQHADFDERGVMRQVFAGHPVVATAVTSAQYALANMTAVHRGERSRAQRARIHLDWLVEAQERSGEWAGAWLASTDDLKYRWLRAPWTGCLAFGNPISALLRGWELFGDDAFRASAQSAYAALHAPRDGTPLYHEDDNSLWYEEYPATPPMHVLNGHIYTLLGVLDYARAFNDQEAHRRWRKAAATVAARLDDFDLGYWSLYDLGLREPAHRHYHKNIHIPQLRILAALTGDDGFAAMADRWESYLHRLSCRARWWFELRARRWRPQATIGA